MTDHTKIYELDLFEVHSIDDESFVERVPGGWLYFYKQGGRYNPPVFIPYNDEFRRVPYE